MTACSRNLPVSSTTAILQPVRMPGSMPSTPSWPAGGESSRFSQVFAEDLDGFLVGAVLQLQPDLGLNGRVRAGAS